MECPHCHQEIPGKECPHCNANIPLESHYCMECGVSVEEEPVKINEDQDAFDQDAFDQDAYDMENRVLCPDGTCTGIIVNGKCSECGKSVTTSTG